MAVENALGDIGKGRILTMRQPVGPCVFVTPWNFPTAMGTRKIAPAVAAGCTMVVKPAQQTPLSMLALAKILEGAGLPGGVLNVITARRSGDVIEPLLKAIDAATADPAYGYQRLGDITDELVTKLTAHLSHEESDGLPLIDASLTPQEWAHFAQVHTDRIRADAPVYMPWLLNQASPQTRDAVLGKFPPPLLTAFREQWGPSYAAMTIWPAAGEPAA